VTSASYAPATPYPAENGHDRSLPQPNAYSHSLYRPSGDRPHSQTHHPGIQAGMSSDDGVYHPAGPSNHTYPHSQHSAYHHAMPPPKPAVEAIPPPTPRVAYEPPVFRTFQERKRAKDMALRADSASNLGPSEAYRASTIPHSPQLPLLQHNVPRIPQANLSTSQTATRSVTLPPIPTNNRPLPLPSAPTPLSMLPSIRIPSPLTMTFPQNSPVYSPVQATIERSDTLSSIKSLDRMGFSSSGRRPLPKTPVGVNSSKSLDRGIPMTVASAGFRRKQPSVVSEESSEDGLADGMRSIELSPSPAESHISSRSTVSIVEPEARGSVPLPAIRSPDSDALQDVSPGEDGPSVRIVPPDRASSPAIAFTELPVIAVSSEHAGREIRNPMPSIALPGEPSTLAPSRIQPVGAIVCSGCGQPIIGRIVNAMRQRWHPQCFKCDACRDLLEHVSSYEYEGRAYCHLDYHDVSGSMVTALMYSVSHTGVITVRPPSWTPASSPLKTRCSAKDTITSCISFARNAETRSWIPQNPRHPERRGRGEMTMRPTRLSFTKVILIASDVICGSTSRSARRARSRSRMLRSMRWGRDGIRNASFVQ